MAPWRSGTVVHRVATLDPMDPGLEHLVAGELRPQRPRVLHARKIRLGGSGRRSCKQTRSAEQFDDRRGSLGRAPNGPLWDVDRYAVGVPAAGEPVGAGVTGGGGGGVIGSQALAGGGPAGSWMVPAVAGSRRRMTPSPLLAPTAGKAT
jgi:hypothetical protein